MATIFGMATWLALVAACGVAAEARGRSVALWLALGMAAGPAALVLLLVQGNNREALEQRAIAQRTHRRCPSCAELTRAEAQRCPHCRGDLPTAGLQPLADLQAGPRDDGAVDLRDAIR